MADIGHSVLLKFFIDTSKMAESQQEIESNVPKNQKLRGDLNDVERGDAEDAVYSPVITVTKEETILTKEDLKVQKVVVSENVSERIIAKTAETKDIHTDGSKEEAAYLSASENGESDDINKYPKQTRIPKLNFKQAVGRIIREERSTHEKAVHEPILGVKIRSSIPRLKEARQNAQKIQQIGNGKKEDSQKLDDEFDKIYEEIKDNATDVGIPTPENLKDAEIVESIFEEIIHAYDENVETLKQESNSEKVKSKIPLLKRKSEQDISVPSIRRGSLKKCNSIDDSKIPLQSKSIIVKDLELTKVANGQISESNTINKSLETSSGSKTIRRQKSVEAEHTNISSREVISVKLENKSESPKCKIPMKSHMRDKLESKLSSASLNKFPGKTNIIDVLSSQKVSTETGVEVEKNCISQNITREWSTDEQTSTVNAHIMHTNEGNHTNEQIIKVKKGNELTATTASKITSNITINLNSSSLLTSTETKEVSQNINTLINEKSISVVSSESESVISQSENLSTLNINLISKHSDENNSVIIQESTNDLTKVTEISTTNAQVQNNVTTKGIETLTSLEYDNISNKQSLSEDQKLITKELQNASTVFENSVNNKDFIKEETNETNIDSNIKVGESELVSVISSESQIKLAFDKEKSVELNTVQRIQSIETISTPIIDISEDNNNLIKIDNKETIEKTTKDDKIQIENISQHRAIEINKIENLPINNTYIENKESNIVKKEITIESIKESEHSKKENNATKNTQTININIDSKKIKPHPETDNAIGDVSSKSLISSQIKNINDLEEEDIIILKGKVNRIISRLDSRVVKIEKTEEDIPKNVSVISKVAILERNEPEKLEKDTYDQNVQNDNTKPIIVDEILKQNKNFNYKEHEIFNDIKKSENSVDYYSVYNRVHSSVLQRLKSIETKSNINFNDGIKKEEMKTTKINVEDEIEKFQESRIEDKSMKSQVVLVEDKTNEVFKETSLHSYSRTKSLAELHSIDTNNDNHENVFDIKFKKFNEERRAKSLAELDLGDVVKGRVRQMVMRMNSIEKESKERRVYERCRSRGAILSRAAAFEKKIVPIKTEENMFKEENTTIIPTISEEELKNRIEELSLAKAKYGTWENMPNIELRDGSTMPVIAVGTALLEPKLIKYIVSAAIDLGYRAIDTAFIYGDEKEIGEAIRSKIEDGTVKREDLFIMSKLWSTFHRRDLVEKACRNSLQNMGLEYFDLFMIHNPMSFREGPNPIPKIANVLQYSQHDYLEAWYGMEVVITKGLARKIGFSNFNSVQVERIMNKAKFKPVVNQVECHPYLNQHNLEDFCANRNIKLSCYGVLGSKGTPQELKSGNFAVIDDPLVQVMSAGLGVTPGQLLIAYQLFHNRNAVVKASTGAHLWDNLQALNVKLDQTQVSALDALNKNKRTFTFKGMGDTHKNYPFNNAF